MGTAKESGVTGCLQSTTLRVGPDKYITHFDGYKASAFFSWAADRGNQTSTKEFQRLSDDLGAGIILPTQETPRPASGTSCSGQRRRIEATVEFTPQDILDIRDIDLYEVDAIATRYGVSASVTRNFVRVIGEASTPVEAAERLGDFLRENGRPGLGVLIKLARMTPGDIVIKAENGSYEGIIRDALNYLGRNTNPLSAETTKVEVAARLREGEKLCSELALSLKELEEYPISQLPSNHSERDRIKYELESKIELIKGVMACEHLSPEDGFALWTSLGRGWTTDAQARAQVEILHGAGISLERRAPTRVDATGLKREKHKSKEVKLQSRTRRFPLFGDQRTLISVGVDRTQEEDGASPARSFSVEVRVSDDNLRWQGINRRFIQRINQAYGLSLKPGKLKTRGGQLLVLRQTFTESDLNRIALIAVERVVEAIEHSGLPRDEAERIAWNISSAASREDLVDVLQGFIQEKGLVATGALKRISSQFDSPKPLSMDAFSGMIAEDFAAVETFLDQFANPLDSNTPVDAILKRFTDAATVLETVQTLKERILDYPFYSDAQRLSQVRRVTSLEASLEETLDLSGLSHEALTTLYQETIRYRSNGVRGRILSQLKSNAGLRRVSMNFSGARRYSEILRRTKDGSSTLESCFVSGGDCQTRSFIKGRLGQDNALVDVEIEVSLQQSKTSKTNLIKNFIEPLNLHLSYGAGSIARYPRVPHERRVLVRTKLSAEEIQDLCALTPEDIQRMARDGAFSSTRFESLLLALKQANTGLEKAQVVGEFLAQGRLEGVGAIKTLLGIPDGRIIVTTVNGLLEEMQQEVKETLIAYEGTAVTDAAGRREINARFGELKRAGEKVVLMKQMVSADPFLAPTALGTALKELQGLEERVNVTQEGTTPPRYQAVVV